MTETDNKSYSAELAARLPELTAFDGDQEVGELMNRAFGEPQIFFAPDNPVALTNALLACLLRKRLCALEQTMERIEVQAKVAQAAQQRWRALMRAGPKIVFVNDAGDLAEIPAEIVTLMGSHKAIDITVVDRGPVIAFLQGEQSVAVVPKTLLVSLPTILERGLWNKSPKSRPAQSQSHVSRGTPTSPNTNPLSKEASRGQH